MATTYLRTVPLEPGRVMLDAVLTTDQLKALRNVVLLADADFLHLDIDPEDYATIKAMFQSTEL